MLLETSLYRKDDISLRYFCSSLSDFILRNYTYNRVFSAEFMAGELFNADRALVIFKDANYSEIELYVSCSINYKEKDLACRLLVGNMKVSLVYAIGYCMYLILNHALDTLSFYVLDDNKEMLFLCTKAGMTEVSSDLTRRRKYKTQISTLINIFRDFYNRFVINLEHQYFQELIISGELCYINNSLSNLTDVIQYSDNGFYFKNFDQSVHASNGIFEYIYKGSIEELLHPFLKEQLQGPAHGLSFQEKKKELPRYAPIDLFIFPTFACNLRCRYCYSEASPLKDNLSLSNAKCGIDFIINNALQRCSKTISITFHGGGEPTVNIKLVNDVIAYCTQRAEREGLKVEISGSTNATNYNEEVKFFLAHCSSIQFSFDGTKKVQDLHRPFANERSSYQTVIDNINQIHKDFPNLPFSIRSTVSQKSIDEMQDSVRLFARLGAKTIVFEPLLEVGRALENTGTIVAPNIVRFSDEFAKCKKLGNELKIKVKSSGDALFREGTFCGASRDNCVLTPDGRISTCVEVSDEADSLSDLFLIGQIKDGKVLIDEERVRRIQEKGHKKNPECKFCIAERSCRGNCLTRTLRSNKTPEHFLLNQLCIMQTRLVIDNMETLHSRNNAVHKQREAL